MDPSDSTSRVEGDKEGSLSPLTKFLLEEGCSPEAAAEPHCWPEDVQATAITENLENPIGLDWSQNCPGGATSWPADRIPNGAEYSFDFSSLYQVPDGRPGVTPQEQQLNSGRYRDRHIWQLPAAIPSRLLSPTSGTSGVGSAKSLPSGAQCESELQPGEFILDFLAPVSPVQNAGLPSFAGEDGFFPLVKFTDISVADVSVKSSIEEVCKACPSVIETRHNGGHRLNATGVPCYRSDCGETDTYLVETVSRQKLFYVNVSCRNHVEGVPFHSLSGRPRWLRNCLDCSSLDPTRVSHAVWHSPLRGDSLISAARCRNHRHEHGTKIDAIVSNIRRLRKPAGASQAPRVPRPSTPPPPTPRSLMPKND